MTIHRLDGVVPCIRHHTLGQCGDGLAKVRAVPVSGGARSVGMGQVSTLQTRNTCLLTLSECIPSHSPRSFAGLAADGRGVSGGGTWPLGCCKQKRHHTVISAALPRRRRTVHALGDCPWMNCSSVTSADGVSERGPGVSPLLEVAPALDAAPDEPGPGLAGGMKPPASTCGTGSTSGPGVMGVPTNNGRGGCEMPVAPLKPLLGDPANACSLL